MEHIRVNNKIRLETVKLSMATIIFSAIEQNREYLKKWLPFVEMTHTEADTEKFLLSVINQPPVKKDDIYCIWYNNEFAGLIGFKDTDWINHKTELGYWLVEKMQGKGVVTLSLEKLIVFAFQKLKLNRIQIKIAIGNIKSRSIAQRLGFKLEGIERSGELHRNKFLDLEIFSLLKKDWIDARIKL